MKKITIISAMLLGASSFSLPALAQSTPIIPGSETAIEQENAAERDAVAAEPGNSSAETSATPDTIVPGSETGIEMDRAAERDNVAEDTDATTTGAMTPDGTGPLIPGSGATFSPGQEPRSQAAEALQDEPSN